MVKNKFRQLCRGTSLVALAAVITMPTSAIAKEEGDLLIRARGIYITPDKSATICLIGGDASVDYEIGEGTYINFDIKKLWLSTDVTIDATTVAGAIVAADVKLNPWIFGIGIGKTF